MRETHWAFTMRWGCVALRKGVCSAQVLSALHFRKSYLEVSGMSLDGSCYRWKPDSSLRSMPQKVTLGLGNDLLVFIFHQYHHVEARPELVRRYKGPLYSSRAVSTRPAARLFPQCLFLGTLVQPFKILPFLWCECTSWTFPCCVESVY